MSRSRISDSERSRTRRRLATRTSHVWLERTALRCDDAGLRRRRHPDATERDDYNRHPRSEATEGSLSLESSSTALDGERSFASLRMTRGASLTATLPRSLRFIQISVRRGLAPPDVRSEASLANASGVWCSEIRERRREGDVVAADVVRAERERERRAERDRRVEEAC